ncbi:hypothetical protein [Streptomyces sp. NPDC058457]|uniref:hypothetical protein n=1 Tax=Streptomyces sp. NPDC058457 TaxID=3346507 RepID=UPI00366895DE
MAIGQVVAYYLEPDRAGVQVLGDETQVVRVVVVGCFAEPLPPVGRRVEDLGDPLKNAVTGSGQLAQRGDRLARVRGRLDRPGQVPETVAEAYLVTPCNRDAGIEEGRVAGEVEAFGLQYVEGPGHSLTLFCPVGHSRGQSVVAGTVDPYCRDESCAVEHSVGGALLGGSFVLLARRHAKPVQVGVDGGEQIRDAAAVPGIWAVGLRVVDHLVHRGLGGPVTGHHPALGGLGVLGGRFLRWRDDQRTPVWKVGVDDVVAEAVLDGALQAALTEGSGEGGVPVGLFGGRKREGRRADPGEDARAFLLEGDEGVVGVHGVFPLPDALA